ncbi:MAG: ACT domain-containing protein [Oscillospiraceae bacterium]|nr:ACT domain-containing protein [Oscillospiraceae bacterium]
MNIHQISVFLENRTGQLAEITGILAENHIDLRAISIAETADYGIVRMIVDNTDAATAILLNAGYILSTTWVQVIAVPNEPGGLASVLKALAENSIAIEYMYSLFTHGDHKAYMVFRVSEEDKFVSLMASLGVAVIPAGELGIR